MSFSCLSFGRSHGRETNVLLHSQEAQCKRLWRCAGMSGVIRVRDLRPPRLKLFARFKYRSALPMLASAVRVQYMGSGQPRGLTTYSTRNRHPERSIMWLIRRNRTASELHPASTKSEHLVGCCWGSRCANTPAHAKACLLSNSCMCPWIFPHSILLIAIEHKDGASALRAMTRVFQELG